MIEWCNSNQGFIMAVLTFVYVATTIFIWLSNKKTNKVAMRQLDEMRIERLTREQPFIVLDGPRFIIERPKFFYTPPEDEYSFQSRYSFSTQINNMSDYPALLVDIIGAIVLNKNGEDVFLKSITERVNILNKDKKEVELSLTGDDQAFIFEAIREKIAKKLPKIEVVLYYKSASGAYFRAVHSYYVVPSEKNEELIRDWHGKIVQAPTKYQEELSSLKHNKEERPQWNYCFQKIADDFDNSLLGESEISLQLIDIPDKYSLKQIDEDTYNNRKTSYRKFVGVKSPSIPPCMDFQKQDREGKDIHLIS